MQSQTKLVSYSDILLTSVIEWPTIELNEAEIQIRNSQYYYCGLYDAYWSI